MAASDEKLWTVDASCCGQKGLLWRHLLGGDKFITRAGDTKTGFAENGLKFAGVEEYRGWVRNVQTGLWLPIRDIPATGAGQIDDDVHARGVPPTGRGKQARDASMTPIPYLHTNPYCPCGGKWCQAEPLPPAPEPEAPRRRKPLEFVRPPEPAPIVKRPVPKRGCVDWIWWQFAAAWLLLALLLVWATAPQLLLRLVPAVRFELPAMLRPDSGPERGWRTSAAPPPLHQSLSRWFR